MSPRDLEITDFLRRRPFTLATRLGQGALICLLAWVATHSSLVFLWLAAVAVTAITDSWLCQRRLTRGPQGGGFGVAVYVSLALSATAYSAIGPVVVWAGGTSTLAAAALVLCAVLLNAALMSRNVRPVIFILTTPPGLTLVLLPLLALLAGAPMRLDEAVVLAIGGIAFVGFVGLTVRAFGAEARAMQRLLVEREQALDAAEAASRAKSDFLATVSHEIRTPLNGVLGMAQAMASEPLAERQAERLDVITRSGQLLLGILNDVLDVSKIEAGGLELESVEFSLSDVAQDAEATFAALADEKELGFSVEVAEAARGVYRGDPVRLRQVLHNLISNALKFTDAGEVRARITLEPAGLMLEVRDTGIGIPAAAIARLFDKFVQADASTTRRYGGTGLGLAICSQLCEAMGGSIRVRSVVGEGSVFTACLPLDRVGDERPAASPDALSPAAPSADSLGEDGRALRILVAEDNRVNQLVLKALLGEFGIEPTLVDDGAKAVEAWRSDSWDLILMDMQMPRLDGVDATRAIRADEAATGRSRTPVVALTANVMPDHLQTYRDVGMDGVVAKPIKLGELVAAIEAALAPADPGPAAGVSVG